jgi:hypothetical protein
MRDICKLIWWVFIGLFQLRVALVAGNLALRQQINVLRRTAPRFVEPDTVIRWRPATILLRLSQHCAKGSRIQIFEGYLMAALRSLLTCNAASKHL